MGDEAFTDHTNVCVRELSLHNFNDLNDTNQGVFENLSRARASADDALDRLKVILGAGAGTSLNVARVLAYGGYAYTLLGEGFCEAPIAMGPGLRPPSYSACDLALRQRRHHRHGIGGWRKRGNAAAATDIINVARVGAARAAKGGGLVKARTYAAARAGRLRARVLLRQLRPRKQHRQLRRAGATGVVQHDAGILARRSTRAAADGIARGSTQPSGFRSVRRSTADGSPQARRRPST
jgi:hypothetical protein